MLKYLSFFLISVITFNASPHQANIYCMDDNNNRNWLYEEEQEVLYVYIDGFIIQNEVNKLSVKGSWYTKYMNNNYKPIKYFYTNHLITNLNELCKIQYGEGNYAYPSNENDYYSNYILANSHEEAESYFFAFSDEHAQELLINNLEKYINIRIIMFNNIYSSPVNNEEQNRNFFRL